MKEIKIGKKKYNLITDISEFPNIRKMLLRQYQRQVFEKIDNSAFENYFDRMQNYFNKGDFSNVLIEAYNYRSSIRFEKLNYDAIDMIFALICIEDGEDIYSVDEDYLQKKVERMNKDGLTTRQAYDSVIFFCSNCPEMFKEFLNLMQPGT